MKLFEHGGLVWDYSLRPLLFTSKKLSSLADSIAYLGAVCTLYMMQ
jgi:hypothetical protein